MKLFYKAGACSLSPHIALIESGLPFELVRVDLATKTLADGSDYKAINPKGQVPALQLDNGEMLTEGAVLVQYIADQAPAKNLIPAAGTLARYRVQEWLNYIGTELHKGFSPLFNAKLQPEAKQLYKELLETKLGWLNSQIKDGQYLTGSTFTVADGYLFNVLSWSGFMKIDLAQWPALNAYYQRLQARPSVQQALQEEGLLGKAA